MFLCDLSFAGFVGANTKTEVTRRAQYAFRPDALRCKRGGQLLLTSVRFGGEEQLAGAARDGLPLSYFAPESFAVRLVLPEVQGKELVVLTLENRSDVGMRFQIELGRQAG